MKFVVFAQIFRMQLEGISCFQGIFSSAPLTLALLLQEAQGKVGTCVEPANQASYGKPPFAGPHCQHMSGDRDLLGFMPSRFSGVYLVFERFGEREFKEMLAIPISFTGVPWRRFRKVAHPCFCLVLIKMLLVISTSSSQQRDLLGIIIQTPPFGTGEATLSHFRPL